MFFLIHNLAKNHVLGDVIMQSRSYLKGNHPNDTIEIIPLTHKDIKESAQTLADAFKNDPLLLWIIGNAKSYKHYAPKMFETYIAFSILYGKAYRTGNFETVAILKTPHTKPLNLFSPSSLYKIISSGIFLNVWYLGISGVLRALQCDSLSKKQVKKHMGEELSWSIWYLGTKPENQNKGLGNKVLSHIINEVERNPLGSQTICVNATTPSSEKLYNSKGYTTYGCYETPYGHRVACLSNKKTKDSYKEVSLVASLSA